MRLEPLGNDRFRGARAKTSARRAVFGGQVLGQALMAASRTVEADRPVHSMHAYFLLPGEHAPIDYAVDRVRDGRSFTTRHVVARQGEPHHLRDVGLVPDGRRRHRAPARRCPPCAGPEGLASELEQRIALGDRLPERWRDKGLMPHGIEYRRVDPDDLLAPARAPGRAARSGCAPSRRCPTTRCVHRALLAYASDHGLLRAAMLPHGLSFMSGQVRAASLDHAMWFHRDFRIDDWLLYVLDSPSASGARGLCRGSIFTRDGRLVASTAQEGMLRVRRPESP